MAEQHNSTSRVTRSVERKIVAGVCGGLAEQFGINAWWFRWSFIVLTFFGFAGVFLYVLAWILIPKETEDDSVATGWMDGLDLTDAGTIFGVVLIGIAGVIVLNRIFNLSSALIAAGVLGLVGVLLYRGDLRTRENRDNEPVDRGTVPPVSEIDAADDGVSGSSPTTSSEVGSVAVSTKPSRSRPVAKQRQPRSILGRLTMAAALITISAMTLVALAGWFTFQPVAYVAAGMGITAVGLLVGAWYGRARWLIIVGVLIAPMLFFTAHFPSLSEWSVGDPSYRPQTIDAVQAHYSLTFGELDIDLTGLSEQDFASIGSIEASVGAGQLDIRIPLGVGVLVRAEVAAGTIESHVIPAEVFDADRPSAEEPLDDCSFQGIDSQECVDIVFDSGDGFHHGEYPNQAYRYDSGIALDKTFSLGTEPIVLELDLSVGAGEIRIQQSGQSIVNVSVEG